MSKRVVIIGSGLGGLSCGVVLQRNGYEVTVLEQGTQAGGCLQCFMRRGVKFETGMNFIGSADRGQNLDRLLCFLGVRDKLSLSRLDIDGYNIIDLAGEEFRFRSGRENFIEGLASGFPSQKDNLVKYFDIVDKIAAASSLRSFSNAESDTAVTTEYQLRSVNEVIDSVINDKMLAAVLAGDSPLYAGEYGRTPFSTHAFITDFYNNSSFRVVGGSDNIAKSLVEEIRRLGGEVKIMSRATRIITDSTRATAVEVNSSEIIRADIVISSCHPEVTMSLIDSKLIRPAYRQRISAMRQTVGAFTVYMAFKPQTVRYINSNVYCYNESTPWNCEIYDENSWPKGYIYMHMTSSPNQEFADAGVVISYMQMSDLSRWYETGIGRRGHEYEEFKRIKAERLIDSLSKKYPGIRECIAEYYTSTPLTYRDYTSTKGGSMYGIARDISAGVAQRVSARTRIPNLFLTGQNINSHGILGVLIGSMVTLGEIMSPVEIYRQINEANE